MAFRTQYSFCGSNTPCCDSESRQAAFLLYLLLLLLSSFHLNFLNILLFVYKTGDIPKTYCREGCVHPPSQHLVFLSMEKGRKHSRPEKERCRVSDPGIPPTICWTAGCGSFVPELGRAGNPTPLTGVQGGMEKSHGLHGTLQCYYGWI